MADTLKSKSFQPLGRTGNSLVFLRPDFIDPGLNRRSHHLNRKPVYAPWRLTLAPERRPRPPLHKPDAAGIEQPPIAIAFCKTSHILRLEIQPHLPEVRPGQGFQNHPFTFNVSANARTVAGPAVSIVMHSRVSRSVQLWALNS